jgi:hypothetical protein
MGKTEMINPPMPDLVDKSIQEEVRKAFIKLTADVNAELDALRAQINALTP